MEFSADELALLESLDTPQKIQDFIDTIPNNQEPEGDTCISPIRVLRENRAHCIEAAMLAALILRMHGHKPLIVDLTANDRDQDHVIAVFRVKGYWGAIANSNFYCLGYRDPVYRSLRELVLSYFHEYLNLDGEKTLRSYTRPLNLSRFDEYGWTVAEEDVWYVPEELVGLRHLNILNKKQEALLRNADPFVREVNNLGRDDLLVKDMLQALRNQPETP